MHRSTCWRCAKAGAVLRMGPVQQHTSEHGLDPLTVQVYAPTDSGGYALRNDACSVDINHRSVADVLHVLVEGARGSRARGTTAVMSVRC